MNFYQAHAILDKVKDGTNYPPQIVLKALEMTGDTGTDGAFQGLRSERMDSEISRKRQPSPKLVAENIIRNSKVAWGISPARPTGTHEQGQA
jgi:hypothetical protein